jgi:hypothetical protein
MAARFFRAAIFISPLSPAGIQTKSGALITTGTAPCGCSGCALRHKLSVLPKVFKHPPRLQQDKCAIIPLS